MVRLRCDYEATFFIRYHACDHFSGTILSPRVHKRSLLNVYCLNFIVERSDWVVRAERKYTSRCQQGPEDNEAENRLGKVKPAIH